MMEYEFYVVRKAYCIEIYDENHEFICSLDQNATDREIKKEVEEHYEFIKK